LLALPFVAWLEGLRGRSSATALPGVVVGSRGALTALASAVKLLEKRAPHTRGTDRLLHASAPILALIPALAVPAIIPLQRDDPVAATLPFVVGLSALSTGAVALAGWGTGNQLALLAALRLVALRLSVLVVIAASALAVVRDAASVDLGIIIESQSRTLLGAVPRWGVLIAPTGFFATLVALAIHAQVVLRARTEPSLAEPWFGGATGPVHLGHRVFETLDLLAGACLLAVIFLGGWHVPMVELPGPAITIGKVAVALVLIVSVRNRLPTSLTPAIAMRICFIGLLPIAVMGLVLLMLL
jgi:NADH-quinone oxidoreductase subunit H